MTLRRECSWCKAAGRPCELPPQPGDEAEPDAVSHGICEPCERAFNAGMGTGKQRLAMVAYPPGPAVRYVKARRTFTSEHEARSWLASKASAGWTCGIEHAPDSGIWTARAIITQPGLTPEKDCKS